MAQPVERRVYLTGRFWAETFERAVKTAIQMPLGAWVGGDMVMNVFEMDWSKVLGLAITGFILSVATSIVSAPVGPTDTPSTV